MTKTLIINYRSMAAGGIETYLFNLAKHVISINGRVIWMCDPKPRVSKSFEGFMMSPDIERVKTYSRGTNWFKHDPISFGDDEEIVVLSFTPFEFAQSMALKKEISSNKVNIFYVVANFVGKSYYLEQYFTGFINKVIKKAMTRVLASWEKNNYIRFFSKKHILCYEENYGIEIKNQDSKLLKPIYNSKDEFDYNLAHKRAKRDFFNLITVGRFDFPHKGYILGLIKTYGKLKGNFPQLTLTIVGHGKEEYNVLKEIDQLPLYAKQDVFMVGEVLPDRLKEYLDKMHLNVGVAGAVRTGAQSGVPSIPARHYCYDCETYGFLPQSKSYTLSTEKGEDVSIFIEKVINMSDENYIELCERSYKTFKIVNADPLYFFRTTNSSASRDGYFWNVLFIKIVRILAKIYIYTENIK